MADFRTKFIKDRPNLRVIFDNSFDDGLKVAFSKEYGSITDLKIWNSLNEAENALSNWKSLYTKNIVDRASPSIIKSDADVINILKHYAEPTLRNKLELLDSVKRWYFLRNFKDIDNETFNLLKVDDDFLDFWFRLSPEAQSKIAINNNAKVLLTHRSNYPLLYQGKYNEVIAKYNHPLEASKTVPGFPGARYIATTPDEDLILVAERANNNNDILPIANNLGIPEYVSKGAKENYWVKERLVLYEKNEDIYAFG